MKISLTSVVLALAGLNVAQQLSLPTCAQGCVTQFTTGNQIGNCASLDIRCICSSTSFLSNIACCLASVCSAADQQAAVTYAQQICNTAGVTVPDQVVCSSASSATFGTTSFATSPALSTSSIVSSAASTSSSVVSVTASTSSSIVSATASTSSSVVSATASTSSSVVSATASTSSSVAASTKSLTLSHTLSVVPSLSVTHNTSPSASIPFTMSSTLSSTMSTTANNFTTSSNSTLSHGAEAGIGVGAAFAIIILAAVLFFFFQRRRRSRRGLLDQEMHSAAPIETMPEMETKANIHEISSKPASDPVLHVLSKELSNDQPQKNNAVEIGSYIVENAPQSQRYFDSARQDLAEMDALAIEQAGLPQMHELDSHGPVSSGSATGAALEISGDIPEAQNSSAQEISAISLYPTMVEEKPNNLKSSASSEAQGGDVGPQAVPEGVYAAPGSQTQAAQSLVTSKLIKRKSLPLSISGDAQPSELATERSGSSRLDVLRFRIDKVREEKERLARLQELDYLEVELQREIMDEQRKELGTK